MRAREEDAVPARFKRVDDDELVQVSKKVPVILVSKEEASLLD